ncbi:MAG: hypothetical protein JOZ90_06170 [Alphaproteobacteria bacterium]|nr:hypothetical protein [Alphaproteobacteria bacterium]MBV9372710.1 hypothetical protein [Alphaproteobacteria bacterium]MBV9900665.1 hypothetical protein [Alphaproteobacteria bacterium]
MPRYFLHLKDGNRVDDEDGMVLDGPEQVREEAVRSARDMMCDQVRQGRLSLKDRIEVEDEAGNPVLTLAFRDAVQLEE